MIEITGALQKQAWDEGLMPPIEEVRPLVWSVPIPFQEGAVRYTLSYLASNSDGQCIIIDPGWDSDEGWSQLLLGLEFAGLSLDAVVGIVVTHLHRDHLGMAARLAQHSGAWIGMHAAEHELLERRSNLSTVASDEESWFSRCGIPNEEAKILASPYEEVIYNTHLARPTVALEDGARLPLAGRELLVFDTPGHTVGHVCVLDIDNELIFTGDHLLPRISSNVGLVSGNCSERQPISEFYRSLDRVAQWPQFEACPAHEYRFSGVATRAADLKRHHHERAGEIRNVLSTSRGLTIWDLALRLSWSRGWESLNPPNRRLAVAETAAHAEHLVMTGNARWELCAAGAAPTLALALCRPK